MPELSTRDATIYYEVCGDGPAVVFLHGVGGNSLMWWQQIPAFAQNHKVIVMDHRGFGRSTDARALGRSEFVNDLAALLDALAIEKCALVGQSMGGIATVGYTCEHPERVSALVLADTLLGLALDPELSQAVSTNRSALMSLPTLERALTQRTVTERPELAYLFTRISSLNKTSRHTLQGDYTNYSTQALGSTGVPTLFITGAEDVLYPPRFVMPAQDEVRGSSFVELQGAGHSAYFEQPEAFNAAVLRFIETSASGVGVAVG